MVLIGRSICPSASAWRTAADGTAMRSVGTEAIAAGAGAATAGAGRFVSENAAAAVPPSTKNAPAPTIRLIFLDFECRRTGPRILASAASAGAAVVRPADLRLDGAALDAPKLYQLDCLER